MSLKLYLSEYDQPKELSLSPVVRVVEVSGERGTLLASVAAPPGAPVTVVSVEREFEARVKECQRAGEGGFLLQVRWVNLSKQARVELAALTEQAPAPHSR